MAVRPVTEKQQTIFDLRRQFASYVTPAELLAGKHILQELCAIMYDGRKGYDLGNVNRVSTEQVTTDTAMIMKLLDRAKAGIEILQRKYKALDGGGNDEE